jgi:hypothetical protein
LSTTDDTPEQNEILAAAKDAKAARERATAAEPAAKGNKLPLAKIGVAAGLGSAALAAAVLFAQRRKRD